MQYFRLPEITIGGYNFQKLPNGTKSPVTMILRQYTLVEFDAVEFSYMLNGKLKTGQELCFGRS